MELIKNFKFNRSAIAKKAWILVKEVGFSLAEGMKQAWYYAKNQLSSAIAKRDKKANEIAEKQANEIRIANIIAKIPKSEVVEYGSARVAIEQFYTNGYIKND